jgi:YfiH family protein
MHGTAGCNLYPFKIDGTGKKYAVFPFIFDGKPLDEISCIITLRAAGNLHINMMYKKFFAELGIAGKKFFHCEQTHSRDVGTVTKDDAETPRNGDGLAAKGGGIGLFVSVADCLPVFLFDSVNAAFAVIHSGWKGTGIAENALHLMTDVYQTKPEDVAAVFGPCIRSCCYDVDKDRAMQYEREFGGGKEYGAAFPLGPAVKKRNARWYIDLQAANAALLVKNGVRNIAYCTNCTFTDENFGSFRREGAQDYTKMMALAVDLNKRSNHV